MMFKFKKTITTSIMALVLLMFAVVPAFATNYAGPNTPAAAGGLHDGTVGYGSGHYWNLDYAGHGSYTLIFTNSSTRVLDVVLTIGGTTLYSGKLGAGSHTIPYTVPTYISPGNRNLMVFNGVLDGSFASASYTYMYN